VEDKMTIDINAMSFFRVLITLAAAALPFCFILTLFNTLVKNHKEIIAEQKRQRLFLCKVNNVSEEEFLNITEAPKSD
jgi:hypothetical protein